MEEEVLACISNQNIKYLESGQISKYIFPSDRETAHRDKINHLIVRFFVITITPDDKILYLVQKRSEKKTTFPNYYTDSASGHVIFEKQLNLKRIEQNAVRELKEEFGISRKSIKSIKFYDLKAAGNEETTEIAYVFLGLVDNNVKIKPNPEELDVHGSKFYTKAELKKLLEVEKSIDYSKMIWQKLLNVDLLKFFTHQQKKRPRKTKVALFIGRFQPLHHGHIHVIKNIYKYCDKIKIGIGSSQLSHKKNDPFTSEERKQFIESVLEVRGIQPNKFDIYDIPDIFDAKKWVDHVVSIVGDFDVVFSNSEWVRQLFQNKGYKIGKKIEIFKNKFNGSHVRKLINNSDKEWVQLVPNEVIQLIKHFGGIERIQSLYDKND